MSYTTILFDLDGTLTEPAKGIVNSLEYALEKLGRVEEDKEKLLQFIGPPLQESFKNVYAFTEEETQQAITYYRSYFAEKGIFENQLYDGIVELLEALKKSGKQLFVATSKPENFAKQIIEHFGLAPYFKAVVGATLDNRRSKKSEVIAHALKSYQIVPADTVMIGDRKFDILGAKDNKLASIGVLYGYGSKKELENAGATALVANVSELKTYLIDETKYT